MTIKLLPQKWLDQSWLLKLFLYMKLTFALVLLLTLQVTAKLHSQEKISLTVKNERIDKVLKLIEKQSKYHFVYSSNNLDTEKRLDLNVTNASLSEVLDKLFNSEIKFRSTPSGLVILSLNNEAMSDITVKGKVTDKNGPLPGVSVYLKSNPGVGTTTDADGNFAITVPDNGVLVIKSLGYKTVEVAAKTGMLNIVLEEADNNLTDVVVVGYGTQKRANLTGAVATISANQIKDRPVTSLQNALQGITPGVTVIQRPGDTKSVGTITVRGRTNLSAPSPMIIIDGIPATNTQFASLNQNDVESMSVLKDAASASIYGSRAANGVIVVTTKKGNGNEKPVIDFNMTYGLQSPTRLPEYTNSTDYATLLNEAYSNAGRALPYTAAQIEKFGNGSDPDNYANTNWYKEALVKNPAITNSTISISSAGKATNYYMSASYLNQESLVQNKDQNRYNLNLNADTKINSILKIGTNISYYRQNYDTNGGELNWVALNRLTPIIPVKQSDGSWGNIAGGAFTSLATDNVMRTMAEAGKSNDRNNYLQTAGTAVLTPVKGLTINGLVSLKTTNANSWVFTNTMNPLVNFLTKKPVTSTAVIVNELKEIWSKNQNFLVQGFADYEYTANKHYGKIMVGASQESNITRYAYLGRKNFPNNDLTTIITGSSTAENVSTLKDENNEDVLGNSTRNNEWAIRSFFGRFNYAYDNKYLLEANVRMDYSSRFDSEFRKAVFPSFSGAWRVSQEDFMKNVNWISDLKLRGSWGILGNQDAVPLGNYFALLNSGYSYSFDGSPGDGVWQSTGTNRLATWEKVHMTNFGLDFSVLKGKLNLTADYFVKNTTDILILRNALATYGLTAPFRNAGSVKNKGLEIGLTYNDHIGDDFKYSISANISKISNKITDLGGDNNRITGTYYIEQLGQSVGSFYGYQADGLFGTAADVTNHAFQSTATKAGDIKYIDQNGDNKIDAADRTIIGNDVPWLNYGVSLNANYKGFNLEVLTYGVADVKTYLDNEASFPFFNGAGVKEQLKNRWTTENPDPNAHFPRLLVTANGAQNYTPISSFWLFNGSYFRIRGITLGYSLPTAITQKIKAQSVRFFITSTNPFTFMADKRLADYDPESGSGRGSYPGMKTWSLGANIRF